MLERTEVNDNHAEDLVLLDAGPKGLGVFARRAFRSGETVLSFTGPLLRAESIADFTHTIQVDADHFLGASGGLDDFVNHSCEPNCILRSTPRGLDLVAMRKIRRGEEATFDYSTCLLHEPPLAACYCGAPGCRHRIDAYWDLAPAKRRYYRELKAVPTFLLRRPAMRGGRLVTAPRLRVGQLATGSLPRRP